jgi:hypothetical protein
MKKALSVMILLAFFGSTIIMTGCLGGSDGIGAVLAAGFVIAIVASSGGSAAPTVFAANQKAGLRPAITSNSTDVSMRVLALDDVGKSVATYTIESANIDWNDQADGIDTISSKINIPDGYNQYRVQVLYDDNGTERILLEGINFFKTSEKSGEETMEVTATSTAKVKIYDKWNINGTERNFKAFENYVPSSDVSPLANDIATDLGNENYDLPNITVPAAPTSTESLRFHVTGFVTAIDGTGSTGTMLYVYDANDQERNNMIYHSFSEEGDFTLNLQNGNYVVVPSKDNHNFTPTEKAITVKNDDLVNVNFQAAPAR